MSGLGATASLGLVVSPVVGAGVVVSGLGTTASLGLVVSPVVGAGVVVSALGAVAFDAGAGAVLSLAITTFA